MFVMGGALVVALPMYQVLGLASRSKAIADWAARPVTAKGSLVGGVMFGCGWGLCGMCPGELRGGGWGDRQEPNSAHFCIS